MNPGRAVLLILLTGLLGLLSSVFWIVPNGLMAAVLAMSLSGGTVWLKQREHRGGQPPSTTDVNGTGIVSGLIGGALAALIQWQSPYLRGGGEIDFGPPQVSTWIIISGGALYGLVLHHSNHRRIGAAHPLRRALGSAVLGCLLVRIATVLCSGDDPIAALFIAAFGGIPFALLWILATARLVPAWKPLPQAEPASPACCVANH